MAVVVAGALQRKPGRDAVTSVASSASLLARLPSSRASISAPRRVNPTMSTKQTVISLAPPASPASRSAGLSLRKSPCCSTARPIG
jgi:hypothetical protein